MPHLSVDYAEPEVLVRIRQRISHFLIFVLMLWWCRLAVCFSALALLVITILGISAAWTEANWVVRGAAAVIGIGIGMLEWRQFLRPLPRRFFMLSDFETAVGSNQALLTCLEAPFRTGSPALWSQMLRVVADDRFCGRCFLGFHFRRLFCTRLMLINFILGLMSLLIFNLKPVIFYDAVSVFTKRLGTTGYILSSEGAELIVKDIRYQVRYPAYLNMPDAEKSSLSGAVIEPAGSKIHLFARMDGAQSITVKVVDDSGRVKEVLADQKNNEVQFSIVLASDGLYWFEGKLASGERLIDPIKKDLRAIVDENPRIGFEFPKTGEEYEMGSQAVLSVLYRAQDDHGLVRLGYVVKSGAKEREVILENLDSAPVTNKNGKFDLRADDPVFKKAGSIEVVLFAVDNDSLHGGKRSQSDRLILRIHSESEVREKEGRQWSGLEEALTTALGGLLELEYQLRKGSGLASSYLDQRSAEWKKVTEVAESIQPKPNATDDADLVAQVQELAVQSEESITELRRRVDSQPLGILINRAEKITLELMDRISVGLAAEISLLRRELDVARKELADLLEKYRAKPSEEVKQQIQGLLSEIQKKIERLSDRANMSNGDAGDVANVDEGQMDSRQLSDAISDILRKLSESRNVEATADLNRSLQELEGMLNALQEKSEYRLTQYEKSRYSALNELQEDLVYMKKAERELIRKTENTAKDLDRSVLQTVDQEADGRSRLERWVRMLRTELALMVSSPEPSLVGRVVGGELIQISEDLSEKLKQRDYVRMLESIETIQQRLKQLEVFGIHDRHLTQSKQIATDIIRILKEAIGRAGNLTSETRSELNRLSRRQAKIGERMSEVIDKLSRMEQVLMSAAISDSAEKARAAMGSAQGALEKGDTVQGLQKEKEAEEYIRKAEGAIQQGMQQLASLRKVSAGTLSERIEIPKEVADEEIKRIREEIMKAMSEEPPPGFQEMARRYYEKLLNQ